MSRCEYDDFVVESLVRDYEETVNYWKNKAQRLEDEREEVISGARCGRCRALTVNDHYADCPGRKPTTPKGAE